MAQPMTVVQQTFINWCIAYSKFQIADAMSISMVSHDVGSYEALVADAQLGKYGYCTEDMVHLGRNLFPAEPGQPRRAGFDAAYALVCTELDEWLSGLVMPMNQISFPPDPAFTPNT
ncbi:hypothetical protein BLA23254_07023 [Burkholderia lata]|uniref:Uncharacterized protein n=1 Tax=Burkholderia lata (strain ATCC 17760 / DSM 23089 / LMG 22485 / NCIMB 9086 / R18194 / 383) TaxID=482957 RepID=A0A6P2SA26_BURL3|nr:hypothetical protein [Burkholderia lata]VWC41762.1 hypothetical protein BLA23254_07023 [Burkholderia lata]